MGAQRIKTMSFGLRPKSETCGLRQRGAGGLRRRHHMI
jgi:hypothetical protein